jgi:hypothetical protein
VGEVPALRASADCGCVDFCRVCTPLLGPKHVNAIAAINTIPSQLCF